MKPLAWIGDSLDRLKEFPVEVRKEAGFELLQVQKGFPPSDWKPMAGIGPGVCEIRIHSNSEFRVIYVYRFEESVYVLHAFTKKTQRTGKKDLDLARDRYRDVLRRRNS
ncbi:MAG: type II toxin-antitoxin system RelE/ParE family toxin [Nitrospirae bacterium]|nr:type II toxin-antitoxin system RelE/ParE family toxin [Nitrospirota bacterium]